MWAQENQTCVLFLIVNTPKLELGPDLESMYKLCNFSVYNLKIQCVCLFVTQLITLHYRIT